MDKKLKEAYRQKMERQIKQWRNKIGLIKNKIEFLGADAKVQYARRLEELLNVLDQLEEKVGQLKNRGNRILGTV